MSITQAAFKNLATVASHLNKEAKTARALAMESALAGKCKEKYLPKVGTAHAYEYVEAQAGHRTMYTYSEEHGRQISATIKEQNGKGKNSITENRYPRTMRFKNNMFLKAYGYRRTFTPRPGQEFSFHNAYYHAMNMDDTNLTGWCDVHPSLSPRHNHCTYFDKAVNLKTQARQQLTILGFDEKAKNHVGPRCDIIQESQRLTRLHTQSKQEKYDTDDANNFITEKTDTIKERIDYLAHNMFFTYKTLPAHPLSKKDHLKQARSMIFQAYSFDMFGAYYTVKTFDRYDLHDISKEYQDFLEISQAVYAEEEVAQANMVDMTTPSPKKASLKRNDDRGTVSLRKRSIEDITSLDPSSNNRELLSGMAKMKIDASLSGRVLPKDLKANMKKKGVPSYYNRKSTPSRLKITGVRHARDDSPDQVFGVEAVDNELHD